MVKMLTLSRLSKKLYYHNFFETNISNIKNTWMGINLLINGKMRGDNVITALKRPVGIEGDHLMLMRYPIS